MSRRPKGVLSDRRRILSRLAVLPVALTGCSGMRVTVELDHRSSSAAYRTFSWMKEDPVEADDERLRDPVLHEQIRSAVEEELGRRGLIRVESTAPDILVNYRVALRQGMTLSTVRPRYRYNPGYPPETYMRDFDEGSLVLDVLDGATNRLVWRGVARAEVRAEVLPAERARRIRTAIRQLFRRFDQRRLATASSR